MNWCRMNVDHNVKPLQSTTLHQSWDPSLTRLIHTGQTRLLGYMDDQGKRGGGGYFWCLFWFSLAPHQSLNPNIMSTTHHILRNTEKQYNFFKWNVQMFLMTCQPLIKLVLFPIELFSLPGGSSFYECYISPSSLFILNQKSNSSTWNPSLYNVLTSNFSI